MLHTTYLSCMPSSLEEKNSEVCRLSSYVRTCEPGSVASWLVVLGFNATLTAKVISWQSVTHMCFLVFSHQYLHNFSFQSHRLLFPHASAEVRDKNTPERKVASTRDQTHNQQVMSPTRSPLSHWGGASAASFDPWGII